MRSMPAKSSRSSFAASTASRQVVRVNRAEVDVFVGAAGVDVVPAAQAHVLACRGNVRGLEPVLPQQPEGLVVQLQRRASEPPDHALVMLGALRQQHEGPQVARPVADHAAGDPAGHADHPAVEDGQAVGEARCPLLHQDAGRELPRGLVGERHCGLVAQIRGDALPAIPVGRLDHHREPQLPRRLQCRFDRGGGQVDGSGQPRSPQHLRSHLLVLRDARADHGRGVRHGALHPPRAHSSAQDEHFLRELADRDVQPVCRVDDAEPVHAVVAIRPQPLVDRVPGELGILEAALPRRRPVQRGDRPLERHAARAHVRRRQGKQAATAPKRLRRDIARGSARSRESGSGAGSPPCRTRTPTRVAPGPGRGPETRESARRSVPAAPARPPGVAPPECGAAEGFRSGPAAGGRRPGLSSAATAGPASQGPSRCPEHASKRFQGPRSGCVMIDATAVPCKPARSPGGSRDCIGTRLRPRAAGRIRTPHPGAVRGPGIIERTSCRPSTSFPKPTSSRCATRSTRQTRKSPTGSTSRARTRASSRRNASSPPTPTTISSSRRSATC